MTLIKLIRLFHLISYLIIGSQLIFYLFVLNDALRLISIQEFLSLRKVVDQIMSERWKIIYFVCLFLSLVVFVLSCRQIHSAFFVTSGIALVCLLIDFVLIVKGNQPLNEQVNSNEFGNNMPQWETMRIQWLNFIKYRGWSITAGLISLFIGLLFSEGDAS